jgi:peptidoglycan/LPS O-acetylase OafA/YrhL
MSGGARAAAAHRPPENHLGYRPDIDGLRAIAVLAVLGYHASDSRLRGGFVGVDVFFVVSGFLITGILLRGFGDRAGLVEFYKRRVLRIFPALLVVLAASAALGWLLMFDFELAHLGRHVVAGIGFVSNLAHWMESGYFEGDAKRKPLLHLWSLGIEEQFYLLWPALLWLAWRLGRPLAAALLLAVSSFVAGAFVLAEDPQAAFFLPHLRVWELLLGSALAAAGSASLVATRAAPIRELLSVSGAGLLAVAVLGFDEQMPFPGFPALVPTIGTLLLVAAGPGAFLNRSVLASPPLVGVGLVSYPLYLWHWPLLHFARLSTVGNPSPTLRIAVLGLSGLLAWLTYRYLERPIRARRSGAQALVLLGLGVVFGGWGVAAARQAGPGPRLNAVSLDLADLGPWPDELVRSETCARSLGFPTHYCSLAPPDSAATVVLLGDSHGNHVAPAFAEHLRLAGGAVLNLGGDGCAPVESGTLGSDRARRCAGVIDTGLDHAARTDSVRTVVLAAAWGDRLQDLGARELRAGLDRTLARLLRSGKRVVFWHDTPDLTFDPRTCLAPIRKAGRALEIECRVDRAAVDSAQRPYRTIVAEVLRAHPTVLEFDPLPYLCDASSCHAVRGSRFLYRDHDHLSRTGALALVEALSSLSL